MVDVDTVNTFTSEEIEPIEVPAEALSAEALHALIESFVLREGTDYGQREVSLEEKVSQIRVQIQKRFVRIVFDTETQTVNLIQKI